MAKFDNAKVGDNVWSSKNGWGKITKIDNSKVCGLLEVTFLISSNGDIRKITYTFDGRESLLDLYPTLFWNEVKLPTEEEDRKPFNLVEFLRDNLQPKEFENGKPNYYLCFTKSFDNSWSFELNRHTDMVSVCFKEGKRDVEIELIRKSVTPQQLRQAYKKLGWL